jgi:hypothetical protein
MEHHRELALEQHRDLNERVEEQEETQIRNDEGDDRQQAVFAPITREHEPCEAESLDDEASIPSHEHARHLPVSYGSERVNDGRPLVDSVIALPEHDVRERLIFAVVDGLAEEFLPGPLVEERQNGFASKRGQRSGTARHTAVGRLRCAPEVERERVLYLEHAADGRVAIQHGNAARDRAYLRVGEKGRDHLVDRTRLDFAVGVDRDENVARGSAKPRAECRAFPLISLEANQLDQLRVLAPEALDVKERVVARAVIDDDDLEAVRRIVALRDGADALLDHSPFVERRNDDAHPRPGCVGRRLERPVSNPEDAEKRGVERLDGYDDADWVREHSSAGAEQVLDSARSPAGRNEHPSDADQRAHQWQKTHASDQRATNARSHVRLDLGSRRRWIAALPIESPSTTAAPAFICGGGRRTKTTSS